MVQIKVLPLPAFPSEENGLSVGNRPRGLSEPRPGLPCSPRGAPRGRDNARASPGFFPRAALVPPWKLITLRPPWGEGPKSGTKRGAGSEGRTGAPWTSRPGERLATTCAAPETTGYSRSSRGALVTLPGFSQVTKMHTAPLQTPRAFSFFGVKQTLIRPEARAGSDESVAKSSLLSF